MNNSANPLHVICIETEAFYELFDNLVDRMREKERHQQNKWISDQEAMQMLGIKSTTTLQKYRDEGQIRFSQPSRKVILYDRDSILDFLERHAKDCF